MPVGTGDELNPGTPTVRLETDFHDSAGASLAVSPDGKRVLVTGWGQELARLVPAR